MVSIPACHAGDPGSIPGLGVLFLIPTPTESNRGVLLFESKKGIPVGSTGT